MLSVKKGGEKNMNNFSTGMIFGAVMGMAVSMVVNPMNKRDIYRNCCRANKMMKKMKRSINHAAHNFM